MVETVAIVHLPPGPHQGFDFGAYRRAAAESAADILIFMNHHSRPLVDGWSERLGAAVTVRGVGLTGCTGSHEGIAESPFPNPHIRTNAFCMRRELFLSLDMPEPQCKHDASMLEAGPKSITRQVQARGFDAVVVDAAGILWNVEKARDSRTFRWGKQAKLMVADNRTDHYANGSPDERYWLQHLAWGVNE